MYLYGFKELGKLDIPGQKKSEEGICFGGWEDPRRRGFLGTMGLCATATDGTDLLCVFHAVCIAEEFRGRPFVLRDGPGRALSE